MANAKSQSWSTIKTDPLRNFRFIVDVRRGNKFAQMGFLAVRGLNMSTEVIPYREGGMNTTTQKLPGQTDFAPITLTKGLAIGDQSMMDWMRELFHVVQGDGTGGPNNDFRSRIIIKVLDHPHTKWGNAARGRDSSTRGGGGGRPKAKAAWRVYNAWPTSVSFSDLDAGANALVIQQMTLAHEGWEFKLANNLSDGEIKF